MENIGTEVLTAQKYNVMKKIIPLLISVILMLHEIAIGQISCSPIKGDKFDPIKKGVNFRVAPSFTSAVSLVSPVPQDIHLVCTDDGSINDFVKVKVDFLWGAFTKAGMNEHIWGLFKKLDEYYSDTLSFQRFFNLIWDSIEVRRLYTFLNESDSITWFHNWTDNPEYDMSTFENFFKYWISYDRKISNEEYILKNQGRVMYAHKSIIKYGLAGVTMMGEGYDADYYNQELEELISQYNSNSCRYSEAELYHTLELYIGKLMESNSYFECIQAINKYVKYFNDRKFLLKIDFMKMRANYRDENYIGAAEIGEVLIAKYRNKQLKNMKDYFFFNHEGDVPVSEVFSYTISAYLNSGKYTRALQLSKECLSNMEIQFKQQYTFHALALYNLNHKAEACSLFNKAYNNGDEEARELLLKYCKE